MSAAPLTAEDGARLAEEWIGAWNSHDVDRIIALYSPDVEFQTPTIIATMGIADGRVRGAEALREHFERGLERLPDLCFEHEQTYLGVRSLAIAYRWRDGTSVAELHEYDDAGLIARVQALYHGLSW